jgi:RNA polymerase sigma factor (sigma-70 family)
MVPTLSSPPEASFDLADCLERTLRGEQDAARALVERCHPRVLRLVRAHRPMSWGEEDLVQEVFLTLFTRLDRYTARPGIPFEHWVARLTVNVCRDALRSERRRIQPAVLSAEAQAWVESLLTDRQPPVDDVLGARQAVQALLAEVPARDRLLLTLLHLEQRSLEEIAQLTGSNRTVLKVRALRARRRLRVAAERLLSADSPRKAGGGCVRRSGPAPDNREDADDG